MCREKTGQGWARDRERGQALILVMLVLLVVGILGTAAVTLAASHRQTAARQRNLVQAYYAADAGVERALVMIRQNPTGSYNFSFGPLENVPCSGGSIEQVTVEEPPELKEGPGRGLKITSVGVFMKARKTLVVKVRVYTPGDLLKGVSIFPPAPDHLQRITGNFTLTGESGKPRPVFLIDGSLDVRWATQKHIDADVYASGSIEGLTGSNIHPHYPAIPPFPELKEEWYRNQANYFYSGDTTFPVESQRRDHGKGHGQEGQGEDVTEYGDKKVYFVDGNVKISGTYSGKAVIVATGDTEVTGNLRADNPNQDLLVLISLGGGVDIKKDNSIVDALIITNGTFSAQGNAQLFGGIVARQLDPNVRVTITCDPTLIDSNQDLLGLAFDRSINPPGIRIEGWSE
ncbi:MAG: PilX N-terminal domain-containing pilus assembly protein [Desulfotomaculales bacterium]